MYIHDASAQVPDQMALGASCARRLMAPSIHAVTEAFVMHPMLRGRLCYVTLH